VSFDSPGIVNEAYRTLRTGILLAQTEQPPKTILFTSAVHGEGKTSTVVNSAISFARTGARVLLIDADLRRPACHKTLGMRRGLGIAELLSGQIKPNWAIQPTHVDNLFFVSSGSSAVDPTEFIGSMKMREILSAVRQPYDYVLVDSPPVMPVSDALLLSTMVDGVVVVIGGRGTSRDTVKQACARLRYAQAKIIGTMLNRVDLRGNGYGEYYYEPLAQTEGQPT
jgi:protein-tyrosine kinase